MLIVYANLTSRREAAYSNLKSVYPNLKSADPDTADPREVMLQGLGVGPSTVCVVIFIIFSQLLQQVALTNRLVHWASQTNNRPASMQGSCLPTWADDWVQLLAMMHCHLDAMFKWQQSN